MKRSQYSYSFKRGDTEAPTEQSAETRPGLVEYALILVLIAIVVIVILALLGGTVNNIFSTIAGSL